jgi:peptide/nickel transport system substrate-binding protein
VNIFDGVGRQPLPILTATSSMQNLYYIPMLEWLDTFELDLGDGTAIKPFDPDYAKAHRPAPEMQAATSAG